MFRRIAYYQILFTFIVMVVGFAMPHHHHQAIFCVTEHHCDNEADTDHVFHDHDASVPHSDSDYTFCISHEYFRLPDASRIHNHHSDNHLCAHCHHCHCHCNCCHPGPTALLTYPIPTSCGPEKSSERGIKPLRAPPLCA